MDPIKNMDKEELENVLFLFDMINEVKYFYEVPVIFLTKKDYSDCVFNTLCKLRTSRLENVSNEDIMDIVVDFHLLWLQAVIEVENFKRRINKVTRDEIYQIIGFSIDSLENRVKYLHKYVNKFKSLLDGETVKKMEIELEIVEAMNKEITRILLEKLTCFRNFAAECEFQLKLEAAADELLNWFDKINDRLAIQCAKHFKVANLNLTSDLVQPLKQIMLSMSTSDNTIALKFIEDMKSKGLDMNAMLRSSAGCNLEAHTISEMINGLEERIKEQDDKNSSLVHPILINKKKYLDDKLVYLNNFKSTLMQIFIDMHDNYIVDDQCLCLYEARIFNHFLPLIERDRLVTDLCCLWDQAFYGQRSRKSIISILSATSIQEEFIDDLGTFYVDRYGRKIYRQFDDATLYQQNEENKLVPLNDDEDKIFFYDECGRYYIDKTTRDRIYKAHASASEYVMGTTGCLLKVKEECEGTTYYYDSYGRYYINEDGKNIYRESDSKSEYEHDGFGNLVRIRNNLDIFQMCPGDSQVSEDSTFLKQTVGKALRESIALVALHQPADPIKYLYSQLRKYRENASFKEKMAKDNEELSIERNKRDLEEQAAAERAALETIRDGVSEASYDDSNLVNYETILIDDSEIASTN